MPVLAQGLGGKVQRGFQALSHPAQALPDAGDTFARARAPAGPSLPVFLPASSQGTPQGSIL